MQVQYYTQWEAISIAELVWFFGLFIASVIILLNIKNKISGLGAVGSFYLSFSITMTCKVVGSILTLATLKSTDFNQSIFAAAYTLNSISLGFTIRCLFLFIEYFYKKDAKGQKGRRFELHPFLVLTLIVITAVILSAVGSILKATGSTTSTSSDLSRAGALLLLASLIAVIVALIHLHKVNPDSRRLFWHQLAIVALLLARTAYSILTSFKITSYSTISPYLFLFGRWEYFAFMVLIPDGLACLGLLGTLSLFVRWYNV